MAINSNHDNSKEFNCYLNICYFKYAYIIDVCTYRNYIIIYFCNYNFTYPYIFYIVIYVP